MNQANRADSNYGSLRAAEARIAEMEGEAIRRREDLDDAIRRLGIENTKRREAEEWSAAWERTAEQLEAENAIFYDYDGFGYAVERAEELKRALARLADAASAYLTALSGDFIQDQLTRKRIELVDAIAEAQATLGAGNAGDGEDG